MAGVTGMPEPRMGMVLHWWPMGLRAVLTLVLAAATICAQSLPNLEIRGRVIEPGLEIGIAGAEITFSVVEQATRHPLTTSFTDSTGTFRFQAPRPGNYFVETKKAGYQGGSPTGDTRGIGDDITLALFTESPVRLTGERPSPELRFYLVRPGEIPMLPAGFRRNSGSVERGAGGR